MALRQQSLKLSASGVSLPRTFTNAFPSLPTTGRDVFFVCNWYGPLPSSVTIAGSVATLDRNHSPYDQVRNLVYRARVGATPNRDVVIAGSGTVYIAGACFEVDALADNPVDQPGSLFTYFPAGSHTITTPATTQADELVIALWTFAESSNNLGASSPATTGYTSLFVEQDNVAYQGGEASLKYVTSTGAQSATWTKTAVGTVIAAMQTYKAAAAPTGNTGSASLVTANAVAAASGSLINVAIAALTTGDAIGVGNGSVTNIATASITAADAVATGTASSSNTASANLITADATVAGVAVLANVAAATLTADDASAQGAGYLVNVAVSALTAEDAVSIGTALLTNIANAALTTDDASAIGNEGSVNSASANLVTEDAAAIGSGLSTNVASAVLVTDDAEVTGDGSQVIENIASAALTTADAALVAFGSIVNVATGTIITADATLYATAGGFAGNIEARIVIPARIDKLMVPVESRTIAVPPRTTIIRKRK